jgi:YidC/Oxa1 family membrane protein insertase
MDKKTVIAFILIGALLILWMYLNAPEPQKQLPQQNSDSTIVSDTTTSKEQVSPKAKKVLPPKEENTKKEQEASKDSLKYGKYFTLPSKPEKIISLENDLVKMEFSTHGGNIKKYYLKKFNNWFSAGIENDTADFYQTHVQLIKASGGGAYDLSFVSIDGKAINTANLDFDVNLSKPEYKVTGNDSVIVTFTLNVDDNKYIKKVYIFYGDKYSLTSEIELRGMNNIISNNAYDLVWNNGIRFVEYNSVDEANYSDASVYYGGDQVVVDASSIKEKKQESFNGRIDWIAVRNKYFAAIIAPKDPAKVDGAYIEGSRKDIANNGIVENYNIQLIVPFNNADFEKNSFTLYIGPVDYGILNKYGNNLSAIVDFGSFFGLKFLVRPIAIYILLPLFNFLHLFIPNYGIVIIVFSLIIKFVLYPLTKSSYQSMKKMQLLQPKITEIKEKYKDDPQKVNKETMKLYSTYGVNPAGGCLPLILQMPIFIALWGLLKIAIDLRQQPFVWWIKDLSQPDIIYQLPFKLPIFGIDQISGLAVLMGVTTFIQQKMSVKDPKQQALIYVMPIFLTIMFMSFPSGLNLYYFMFNVFSIAQQYYINHKHDGMILQPVKNPKKSKGFMQKLMEQAEQNAKVQQQRRKR